MNSKGNRSKPDWKGLQVQANEVLGADFWHDIASVLPNTGPRIDMFETPQEIIVVVEVPGLPSPEHIQLALLEHSLIIRGTLVRGYDVPDEQMLLAERFHGSFERSLRLPAKAVTAQLCAHYDKGLLIIRMPLSPPAGETQIPIQFT